MRRDGILSTVAGLIETFDFELEWCYSSASWSTNSKLWYRLKLTGSVCNIKVRIRSMINCMSTMKSWLLHEHYSGLCPHISMENGPCSLVCGLWCQGQVKLPMFMMQWVMTTTSLYPAHCVLWASFKHHVLSMITIVNRGYCGGGRGEDGALWPTRNFQGAE